MAAPSHGKRGSAAASILRPAPERGTCAEIVAAQLIAATERGPVGKTRPGFHTRVMVRVSPVRPAMVGLTCLAAARNEVLRYAGDDFAHNGLVDFPVIRVLLGEGTNLSNLVALRHRGFDSAGIRSPVKSKTQWLTAAR